MLQSFITATGIYFIFDGIKDFLFSLDLSGIDFYSIIDVCRIPILFIIIALIVITFKNVDNLL